MIEFGGITYYIDLDAYDKLIKKPLKDEDKYVIDTHRKTYLDGEQNIVSVEINEQSSERIQEVNAGKYDIVRTMIDVVLDIEADDLDDTMGAERGLEKGVLSFKLAFNTLYHYGILKEKEQ
jgi:hypothetical protein